MLSRCEYFLGTVELEQVAALLSWQIRIILDEDYIGGHESQSAATSEVLAPG